MNGFVDKLRKLFLLKFKFALTSSVATAVDYFLYLVLVNNFFTPVVSNIISASCGMLINFFLQKRYVFKLERHVMLVFIMSVTISIVGIFLSTSIIYLLNQWPFFQEHQYITKLIATGIVFFYNFYLKRFSFEKRFFKVD